MIHETARFSLNLYFCGEKVAETKTGLIVKVKAESCETWVVLVYVPETKNDYLLSDLKLLPLTFHSFAEAEVAAKEFVEEHNAIN